MTRCGILALTGVVWLALARAPALANDSAAELAAGGIVLTQTSAIVMQREDLTLSQDSVHVRYEMRNDTGKPVTLRVAFPLPDLPVETPSGWSQLDRSGAETAHNIDLTTLREPNFLGFQVTSQGRDQTYATDIAAVLPDGRDIVRDLYRIGGWRLVLRPAWYERDPAPGRASVADPGPAVDRALRTLGAVSGDAASAMPRWATRITFHWPQTFAPGVTVIEHRYRPVLGLQLIAAIGPDPGRGAPDHGTWTGSGSTDLARDFCISGATDATLRAWYRGFLQADARRDGDAYAAARTLGYILRTARNWSGPIGFFHLTVEGAPVALCSDIPLHETAIGRMEATATNYVPSRDLRLLFPPAK